MKLVNVHTRRTITALTVPIRGDISGIRLSDLDIFRCICQKAIVDEVLSDGSLVRLDLANYETDHEALLIQLKEFDIHKTAIAIKVTEANKEAEAEKELADKEAADLLVKEEAAAKAVEFAKTEEAKLVTDEAVKNKNNQSQKR